MSCPYCNSPYVKTLSIFERTSKKIVIEVKCFSCGAIFKAHFQRLVGLKWDLVETKLISIC